MSLRTCTVRRAVGPVGPCSVLVLKVPGWEYVTLGWVSVSFPVKWSHWKYLLIIRRVRRVATAMGWPRLSTSVCRSGGKGRGEGQEGGRRAVENPRVPRARCPRGCHFFASVLAAWEITVGPAPVTCQCFPPVTWQTLLRPPHPPNAPKKRQPPSPFAHEDRGAPSL